MGKNQSVGWQNTWPAQPTRSDRREASPDWFHSDSHSCWAATSLAFLARREATMFSLTTGWATTYGITWLKYNFTSSQDRRWTSNKREGENRRSRITRDRRRRGSERDRQWGREERKRQDFNQAQYTNYGLINLWALFSSNLPCQQVLEHHLIQNYDNPRSPEWQDTTVTLLMSACTKHSSASLLDMKKRTPSWLASKCQHVAELHRNECCLQNHGVQTIASLWESSAAIPRVRRTPAPISSSRHNH